MPPPPMMAQRHRQRANRGDFTIKATMAKGEKHMDREDTILLRILTATEQGTLSKRKWRVYGCTSEDEVSTFLVALIEAGSLIQRKKPHSAAKDGHGRELITWENEPDYFITSDGKADLKRLRDQQKG